MHWRLFEIVNITKDPKHHYLSQVFSSFSSMSTSPLHNLRLYARPHLLTINTLPISLTLHPTEKELVYPDIPSPSLPTFMSNSLHETFSITSHNPSFTCHLLFLPPFPPIVYLYTYLRWINCFHPPTHAGHASPIIVFHFHFFRYRISSTHRFKHFTTSTLV